MMIFILFFTFSEKGREGPRNKYSDIYLFIRDDFTKHLDGNDIFQQKKLLKGYILHLFYNFDLSTIVYFTDFFGMLDFVVQTTVNQ
jgi:hypothetical protein